VLSAECYFSRFAKQTLIGLTSLDFAGAGNADGLSCLIQLPRNGYVFPFESFESLRILYNPNLMALVCHQHHPLRLPFRMANVRAAPETLQDAILTPRLCMSRTARFVTYPGRFVDRFDLGASRHSRQKHKTSSGQKHIMLFHSRYLTPPLLNCEQERHNAGISSRIEDSMRECCIPQSNQCSLKAITLRRSRFLATSARAEMRRALRPIFTSASIHLPAPSILCHYSLGEVNP
jgi:hypothetical protein